MRSAPLIAGDTKVLWTRNYVIIEFFIYLDLCYYHSRSGSTHYLSVTSEDALISWVTEVFKTFLPCLMLKDDPKVFVLLQLGRNCLKKVFKWLSETK